MNLTHYASVEEVEVDYDDDFEDYEEDDFEEETESTSENTEEVLAIAGNYRSARQARYISFQELENLPNYSIFFSLCYDFLVPCGTPFVNDLGSGALRVWRHGDYSPPIFWQNVNLIPN